MIPTTKTLQHHLFLQKLAFSDVTRPEAATSPSVVEALLSVTTATAHGENMRIATLAVVVSS